MCPQSFFLAGSIGGLIPSLTKPHIQGVFPIFGKKMSTALTNTENSEINERG